MDWTTKSKGAKVVMRLSRVVVGFSTWFHALLLGTYLIRRKSPFFCLVRGMERRLLSYSLCYRCYVSQVGTFLS
jgi:hypothetical protein